LSKKRLGLGENGDGYVLAVAVALLIASILLVGYYVTMKPPSNATMTMYLLDSQGKASNYPDILIIGQNNTFDVQVGVENHMGGPNATTCEILVKIVNGSPFSYPVDVPANATYPVAGNPIEKLKDGQTWNQPVSVTINDPGAYSVVFELWTNSQFSGYYCELNLKVTT
jgi:uncharacterized membrane protein